jgi:hypothetical protein
MRMVLVVVIAVAWLVILVPSFLRRRGVSGESDSISHFHEQLRILEHSAPMPIVAPAYRLRGADGERIECAPDSLAPVLAVVGARDLPKPALAFLAEEREAAPDDAPVAATAPTAESRQRADAHNRRLARQRRRDTLCVLVLAVTSSFMIGFLPGAGVAWVATGIFGMALVAYVALLVHLRRLAEERERKLRYLRPPITDLLEDPAAPLDGRDHEGHHEVRAAH